MTPAWVNQYLRIFLYTVFTALGSYGVGISGGTKEIIISVAGYIATFAWTMWGTRLNGLLEAVKEKTGVQAIEIKVDPAAVNPAAVNSGTSQNIVARPAS